MKESRKSDRSTLSTYQKYMNTVRKVDFRDTETLCKLYKNAVGEEKIIIRNKIVENNLPLIVTFLRKRYNYSYDINPVFDIDDIIQDANLLLIKAIDKYAPDRGSFSTFIYKILHKVYYNNSLPNSPINFTRSKTEEYKKIKKYIDLEYDDNYISKCCGINIEEIKHIRPLLTDTVSYEELLERLIAKENEEDTSSLIYEDENLERVLESENIDIRNEVILQALDKLTNKQREFIIVKFGLDGNGERKNRDIVKEIGCHKKYIYEMYKRAEGRLLKNKDLQQVYDLVDTDYDSENKDKTYYLQK